MCKRTTIEGVRLHGFPKKESVRKKWLEFCKKDEVIKSATLCNVSILTSWKAWEAVISEVIG